MKIKPLVLAAVAALIAGCDSYSDYDAAAEKALAVKACEEYKANATVVYHQTGNSRFPVAITCTVRDTGLQFKLYPEATTKEEQK